MGILSGIFRLADDIISIPTDAIGLTNHFGKRRAKEVARDYFLKGKITSAEYEEVIQTIDKI